MAVRSFLWSLIRHPATWVCAGCWFAAAAWLGARGRPILVAQSIGVAAGCLLFCALTIRLTEPPPPSPQLARPKRGILWLQLILLAAVSVVTAWVGLYFHGGTSQPPRIPLWTDLVAWGGRLGQRYVDEGWVGSPYDAVANPMRYFVLPLMLLVPLTGFRYLGFSRGHRVLRIIALWCAIPVGVLVYSLLTGGLSPSGLAKRLVHNTFVNGPFEEFLWRGAIQTRLGLLLGPGWGIALSSLGFGVWHLGLGYRQMGSQSLTDGLAVTVLSQAVMGLAFGVIYYRTRNLIACSTCHVVFNSTA